jgi:hypothetical protein
MSIKIKCVDAQRRAYWYFRKDGDEGYTALSSGAFEFTTPEAANREARRLRASPHFVGMTLAVEDLGMDWWNALSPSARKYWMARAGDTGVAADAWAAYQRYGAVKSITEVMEELPSMRSGE